jgi:hypothetical protein
LTEGWPTFKALLYAWCDPRTLAWIQPLVVWVVPPFLSLLRLKPLKSLSFTKIRKMSPWASWLVAAKLTGRLLLILKVFAVEYPSASPASLESELRDVICSRLVSGLEVGSFHPHEKWDRDIRLVSYRLDRLVIITTTIDVSSQSLSILTWYVVSNVGTLT